jgi:hypothetical protein
VAGTAPQDRAKSWGRGWLDLTSPLYFKKLGVL